jgi:hypothetical protein
MTLPDKQKTKEFIITRNILWAILKGARYLWLPFVILVILATWETDQEDYGSKPTWVNSFRDPISKNTHPQTGLNEWLKW